MNSVRDYSDVLARLCADVPEPAKKLAVELTEKGIADGIVPISDVPIDDAALSAAALVNALYPPNAAQVEFERLMNLLPWDGLMQHDFLICCAKNTED